MAVLVERVDCEGVTASLSVPRPGLLMARAALIEG